MDIEGVIYGGGVPKASLDGSAGSKQKEAWLQPQSQPLLPSPFQQAAPKTLPPDMPRPDPFAKVLSQPPPLAAGLPDVLKEPKQDFDIWEKLSRHQQLVQHDDFGCASLLAGVNVLGCFGL